jgi:hypothetical protein
LIVDENGGQWLETFVKTNIAHVEGIDDAVQRLCKELEGGSEALNDEGQPSTLLTSFRQLITHGQAREKEHKELRGTIEQLIIALRDDIHLNAEMRNTFSSFILIHA